MSELSYVIFIIIYVLWIHLMALIDISLLVKTLHHCCWFTSFINETISYIYIHVLKQKQTSAFSLLSFSLNITVSSTITQRSQGLISKHQKGKESERAEIWKCLLFFNKAVSFNWWYIVSCGTLLKACLRQNTGVM